MQPNPQAFAHHVRITARPVCFTCEGFKDDGQQHGYGHCAPYPPPPPMPAHGPVTQPRILRDGCPPDVYRKLLDMVDDHEDGMDLFMQYLGLGDQWPSFVDPYR